MLSSSLAIVKFRFDSDQKFVGTSQQTNKNPNPKNQADLSTLTEAA